MGFTSQAAGCRRRRRSATLVFRGCLDANSCGCICPECQARKKRRTQFVADVTWTLQGGLACLYRSQAWHASMEHDSGNDRDPQRDIPWDLLLALGFAKLRWPCLFCKLQHRATRYLNDREKITMKESLDYQLLLPHYSPNLSKPQ